MPDIAKLPLRLNSAAQTTLNDIAESKPIFLSIIFALCLATYVHPAFYFILGYILYATRKQLSDYQLPLSVGCVLAVLPLIGFIALRDTLPADDALRHAVSHHFDYDYNRVYLDMDWMPKQSMWFGYEWVLGKLEAHLGLAAALQTMRVLMATMFTATLFACLRKVLPREDQRNLVALMLSVSLSVVVTRLYLTRPEFLLMTWGIAAFVVPIRLWTVIGMVLQPGYFMAWLYIPCVLLSGTDSRNKIIATAILLITTCTFWLLYAGLDWPRFVYASYAWLTQREGVTILENMSVSRFLDSYPALAMAGVVIIGWGRDWSRYGSLLAIAAYFMLPNQARYIAAMTVPLVIVAAMVLAARMDGRLNFPAALLGLLFFTHLTGKAISETSNFSQVPEFTKIPPRSKVLALSDQSMYWLVATRYRDVQVGPAFEFGASRRESKILSRQLQGGEALDCQKLRQSTYDHVISLRLYQPAECLRYLETAKAWQLWRVIR